LRLTKYAIGVVYSGVNIISKEEIAVKLELVETAHPQLAHEYNIYKSITGIGIPSIHWFGTEGNYNAMVLKCLGPSLKDLLNQNNCKFNLKTVLLLANQMVCWSSH
jgi:casein kinase I homolog HRR25